MVLTSDMQDFNLAVNTHVDRRKQVVIDVGAQRQLLFDDFFVAMGKGYEQYPHGIDWVTAPVQKHGAPLFEPDQQFESSIAWASVVKDGGKYRLWYNSGHEGRRGLVVSYAESDDGLVFRRSTLGLIDFQESTQHNVVFAGGLHGIAPELGNVFIDAHAPPGERYKMVYTDWEGAHVFDLPFTHNVGVLRGAASPDGLRWQRYYDNFYGRYCDSQNVACWDEALGRFVIYHRSFGQYGAVRAGAWRVAPERRGRAIGRIESSDFRQWTESEIALQADFSDGLNTDIYNSAYSRYPGAQNCHFLFPSFYRHYEGTFDVQAWVSRDNRHWLRPTRATFIPRGDAGAFDSFIVSVVPGFVPVDDDHFALYYRSGDMPHGGSHPVMSEEEKRTKKSRLGRVVIKRDRIIGIEAQAELGQFSTRPLRFAGNRLVINLEPTAPDGFLRVQLLSTESDRPLDGYGFAECSALANDDLDAPVCWNGSDRLGADIVERPVRLHFQLRNMRVYAFQFAHA